MQTKIQKWGHSLGLRIPRTFAAGAQVRESSTVDLAVDGGRLLVRPLCARRYTLSELLNKVTRRNLHSEVATGAPAGSETW
jgi:antitoxin MazE